MIAVVSASTLRAAMPDRDRQSGLSDLARTTAETRNQPFDAWRQTSDALLSWRQAHVGAAEAPTIVAIDSAIDFCCDHQELASAPTRIAWSGDGGLVFEWRAVGEITTIEFVAAGEAEVTKFRDCRVVQTFHLRRNPITRKLEGQRG